MDPAFNHRLEIRLHPLPADLCGDRKLHVRAGCLRLRQFPSDQRDAVILHRPGRRHAHQFAGGTEFDRAVRITDMRSLISGIVARRQRNRLRLHLDPPLFHRDRSHFLWLRRGEKRSGKLRIGEFCIENDRDPQGSGTGKGCGSSAVRRAEDVYKRGNPIPQTASQPFAVFRRHAAKYCCDAYECGNSMDIVSLLPARKNDEAVRAGGNAFRLRLYGGFSGKKDTEAFLPVIPCKYGDMGSAFCSAHDHCDARHVPGDERHAELSYDSVGNAACPFLPEDMPQQGTDLFIQQRGLPCGTCRRFLPGSSPHGTQRLQACGQIARPMQLCAGDGTERRACAVSIGIFQRAVFAEHAEHFRSGGFRRFGCCVQAAENEIVHDAVRCFPFCLEQTELRFPGRSLRTGSCS